MAGKPRGGYAALFAHSNASHKLPERTNSFKKIMGYFDELWAATVDPKRPVKRINLGFGNLVPEEFATIDLLSRRQRPRSASATCTRRSAVKASTARSPWLRD